MKCSFSCRSFGGNTLFGETWALPFERTTFCRLEPCVGWTGADQRAGDELEPLPFESPLCTLTSSFYQITDKLFKVGAILRRNFIRVLIHPSLELFADLLTLRIKEWHKKRLAQKLLHGWVAGRSSQSDLKRVSRRTKLLTSLASSRICLSLRWRFCSQPRINLSLLVFSFARRHPVLHFTLATDHLTLVKERDVTLVAQVILEHAHSLKRLVNSDLVCAGVTIGSEVFFGGFALVQHAIVLVRCRFGFLQRRFCL